MPHHALPRPDTEALVDWALAVLDAGLNDVQPRPDLSGIERRSGGRAPPA